MAIIDSTGTDHIALIKGFVAEPQRYRCGRDVQRSLRKAARELGGNPGEHDIEEIR